MKVVLITGCSTRIGLALTKEFLKYDTTRKDSDLDMLNRLGACTTPNDFP